MYGIFRGGGNPVRGKHRPEKRDSAKDTSTFFSSGSVECTTEFDRSLGRRRFKRKTRIRGRPSFTRTEKELLALRTAPSPPSLRPLLFLFGLLLLGLAIYGIFHFLRTYRFIIEEYDVQTGQRVNRYQGHFERKP